MKPSRTSLRRFCCLLIFCTSACRYPSVTHVQSPTIAIPNQDNGGIYYALPQTVIMIDIPITRTTQTIANCPTRTIMAERLDRDEVDAYMKMKADSVVTKYAVDEASIHISTRPIPDTNKVFFVGLKGRWNKNQEIALTLNELGQMSDASLTFEDHTLDIVTQGVQAVAGIVSTLITPKASGKNVAEAEIDVPSVCDSADLCDRACNDLTAVRAARSTLIRQSTISGTDGSLKRKLEELDKVEELLVSQLSFFEKKKTVVVRVEVLIDNSNVSKPTELFSFDEKNGIIFIRKPAATEAYLNENLANLPNGSYINKGRSYTLKLNFTPGHQVADLIPAYTAGTTDKGLAYNIPVSARASVLSVSKQPIEPKQPKDTVNLIGETHDGKRLYFKKGKENRVAAETVLLPQLGKVAFIPRKASKSSLTLDPLTGALRKVSIANTGITADQIKNAGTALGSAAALLQPEALTAPLDKATRDNDLLEQKIRANKLQTQLDSLNQAKSKLNPINNK